MWKKIGHLFKPESNGTWMQTHASTPFPVHISGDRYRVYFSTRNARNESSISFLEMELSALPKILSVSDNPVLTPGSDGLFDDSGVTMSQIIADGDKEYLYFQGWNLCPKVPFRCSVGLAVSQLPSGIFAKYTQAPVLDRSAADPYSLSYPWIRIEDGLWRMWYGSTLAWETGDMDVQHVIKYAESKDGVHWDRKNVICIPLQQGESGIVRPTILKEAGIYHMWYSVRIGRKETYRLGYAVSHDGIRWERRDAEAKLVPDAAKGDWDSEMICYPCVFMHSGKRYMLYNGNGFGRTGFGIAIWQDQNNSNPK